MGIIYPFSNFYEIISRRDELNLFFLKNFFSVPFHLIILAVGLNKKLLVQYYY